MCEQKREICDFVQEAFKNAPILSTQRQVEILKEYRATRSKKRKEQLKEQLVATLWRYAVREASKFENIIDSKVARQAAYVGMLRSLDKYRIRSKSALTTCMFWWVRLEIIRTIYKVKYQVHIPEYLYTKIKKLCTKFKDKESLSTTDIAHILFGNDPSMDQLRKVEVFSQICISMLHRDQTKSRHFLPEDSVFDGVIVHADIMSAIYKKNKIIVVGKDGIEREEFGDYVLSDRERDIVCLYYNLHGEGSYGLREIGKKYGITRERVRQILVQCRAFLEEELKDYK